MTFKIGFYPQSNYFCLLTCAILTKREITSMKTITKHQFSPRP